MSDTRKQWIMNQMQYQVFERYRQQSYREICRNYSWQYFDDHLLCKYYIKLLIDFLRRRKVESQLSFKTQKVLHTAVCLFRRYYLVNSFMEEDPVQSILCSIYLAFKLNEYPEDFIEDSARRWRGKKEFKQWHKHFRMDYYADRQLEFLNKFGFQVGRSPLIQPLESLFLELSKHQLKNYKELVVEAKNMLYKIYLDSKMIFLIEGPKLALAIVTHVLENKSLPLSLLGEEISKMCEANQQELTILKGELQKLEECSEKKTHDLEKIEKMRLLRSLTKKPKFQKPQLKKSPKFCPSHESFKKLLD